MKSYKFYIYTAISFILFFVLVSLISIPYLLKMNGSVLLDSNISAAKIQVEHTIIDLKDSNIYIKIDSLNNQLQTDTNLSELQKDSIIVKYKEDIITPKLQDVVKNTESEFLFLSVFNWSGDVISHPDPTKVGLESDAETSDALVIEDALSGNDLYDAIYEGDFNNESKVIYIQSIPDSDLGYIVASHINILNFKAKINSWRTQLYIFMLIISLLTLLIVFAAIRIISSHYETLLDLKSSRIEDGVLNLSKLNASLDNYQKKLNEIAEIKTPVAVTETTDDQESIIKEKERILTYVRNELVPISTEDISYIYVENTITYIVRKDGKRATASESLDQIYSYLNEKSFFRANRQIIVAISAIDKITKFGNSQLKIQVNPASEIDIVIGKNKAAAFKQWLDL